MNLCLLCIAKQMGTCCEGQRSCSLTMLHTVPLYTYIWVSAITAEEGEEGQGEEERTAMNHDYDYVYVLYYYGDYQLRMFGHYSTFISLVLVNGDSFARHF